MADTRQPNPPTCDPAKIRARRRALGLRQVPVAIAAGINQGHLSMIENGLRKPSADVLARLAGALRCDVAEFTPAGGGQ